MALINCPECNNQVSNTAEACPHCGAPISGAKEGHAAGVQIKTIQETSKRLKLHVLFSAFLFWGGLLWILLASNSSQNNADDPNLTPAFMVLLGMVWYVTTKIRIWWHHK